jgi:hypothetical protein
MTNSERLDAVRKRRETYGVGARARRRLSSAIDARRRLNGRAADDPPVDLAARRAAASGDAADAERWLDEGGSFSADAGAEWPAQR